MDRIDFARSHKPLYSATRKIKEVLAGSGTFLAVEGRGEPGGTAFQQAIEALFSIAYTSKFMLKAAGTLDFAVGKLECLWEEPAGRPPRDWGWRMLLRVPAELTTARVRAASAAILEKKALDTSSVQRISFNEGRCLQVLHVGPYDRLGGAYDLLAEEARSRELSPRGMGHEIYLSDPRRTAPERLKTIVRLPVG